MKLGQPFKHGLNFIRKNRINAILSKTDVSAHTVIRQIDPKALTPNTIDQLVDLINTYIREKDKVLTKLETKQYRQYCTVNGPNIAPIELRNKLLTERNAAFQAHPIPPGASLSEQPINNKHWKCAFRDAASCALGYWTSALARTRAELTGKPFFSRLSEEEQHLVNFLLCRPGNELFDVLEHKIPPTLTAKFPNVPKPAELCFKIRTELRKQAGSFAKMRQAAYCLFDTKDLFSVTVNSAGNQVIKLAGKTAGKRIALPLIGKGAVGNSVRLVRSGNTFCIHTPFPLPHRALKGLPPKRRGYYFCHAFDMGRTECFISDSGQSYGVGLGKLLDEYGDWLTEKLRERNRYTARLKTEADPVVRKRIEECNLGSIAWDNRITALKTAIEDLINRAINEMIRKEPAEVYILEAFSNNWDLSRFPPSVRRRMSGWVRGLIAERLEYKAAVFGIQLVHITASYSSQRCPKCSYVSRDNRSGDKFCCKACGHKDHADHNACINLLLAAQDPTFKAHMTMEAVKQFYRAEYLAGCAVSKIPPLP